GAGLSGEVVRPFGRVEVELPRSRRGVPALGHQPALAALRQAAPGEGSATVDGELGERVADVVEGLGRRKLSIRIRIEEVENEIVSSMTGGGARDLVKVTAERAERKIGLLVKAP